MQKSRSEDAASLRTMRVLDIFAPLFGHWQGSEELSESRPGSAITARAMLSFRAEIGGVAMVGDYRQVRADGTEFYGHGVFLVDESGTVTWWLFDSSGRPPVPATGGWRGAELVLTKITEEGRDVHRFGLDDEELTYVIDAGPSEDELTPFLRGRYRAMSTH